MYSLYVGENEYIIGAEKETFLDQVGMLYPEEGVEEAATLLFEYIMKRLRKRDLLQAI